MSRKLEGVGAEIREAREEANSNAWTNALLFIVASGGFGAVAGDLIGPALLIVILSPLAIAASVVALVAVWDLFRLAWGFRGEIVQTVASWRNSTAASIERLKPSFPLSPHRYRTPQRCQFRLNVGLFRLALTDSSFKSGQRLFAFIELHRHFRVRNVQAFGGFRQSFRFPVSGLKSVFDILRQRLQLFGGFALQCGQQLPRLLQLSFDFLSRALKRAKLRALQPRAIFIEAPALPMTGRALSPDAALARIEEIRRSLLDLTSSPSLAPSPTLEEEISRIAAEIARPMEKISEPV